MMQEQDTDPAKDILTFHVGPALYGLDIQTVREIRSWVPPTPLPQSPPHICGVINLRGTVLSILDLGLRLGGQPAPHSARSVIIVAEAEAGLIGLLVTGVSDILSVQRADLLAPPSRGPADPPGFVEALVQRKSDMVRLITLDRILAEGSDQTPHSVSAPADPQDA